MKYVSILLVALLLGCDERDPQFKLKADASLRQWAEYSRTNRPPAEHVSSIAQARAAYEKNPSRETAAELVTLVRLYTTAPVP